MRRHLYLEPKERPYADERARAVCFCGGDANIPEVTVTPNGITIEPGYNEIALPLAALAYVTCNLCREAYKSSTVSP